MRPSDGAGGRWGSEEPIECFDVDPDAGEDRGQLVKIHVVRRACETYRAGRLVIHAHIYFASRQDDFKSAPLDSPVKGAEGFCFEITFQPADCAARGDVQGNAIQGGTCEKTGSDKPVFVAVGEPMQDGKRMLVGIGGMVRLHPLDLCSSSGTHEPEDGRICEVRGVLANRKLDASGFLLGRVPLEMFPGKPKRDMVECPSRVVDEVPKDKSEIVQHGIEAARPPRQGIIQSGRRTQDVMPFVWVIFHDHAVEVRVRPDVLGQPVERIEVLGCPL